MLIQLIYALVLFFSAGMSFAVALMAWNKHSKGSKWLTLCLWSSGAWAIAKALELFSSSYSDKIDLLKIQTLSASLISPSLCALSFILSGRQKPKKIFWSIIAFNFICVFITISPAGQHLFWQNVEIHNINTLISTATIKYGPLFYVFLTINYSCLAWMLYNLFWKPPLGYILGRDSLAIAAILPWIANLAYNLGFLPSQGINLTPIAFIMTSIILEHSLRKNALLNPLPIAKNSLVDQMKDAVLFWDQHRKLLDYNPAAQLMVKSLSIDQLRTLSYTISNEVQIGEATYDLQNTVLTGKGSTAIGYLSIFHDITARKQLEVQLEEIATTDTLTSIPNRRFFEKEMLKEFARFKRYKSNLCVGILDIDFFKSVNDQYGHDAGDTVLREVAQHCQKLLRTNDLIARIGGEEFALVLPETPEAGALIALDRLRDSIHQIDIHIKDQVIHVSVSIGISECSYLDQSYQDAFKRADQALYLAKHAGRNNIKYLGQSLDI